MPALEKDRSLGENLIAICAAVKLHIRREELGTDVSRCHDHRRGLVLSNAKSRRPDMEILHRGLRLRRSLLSLFTLAPTLRGTWAVNSNLELCLFPFPVIFPSPHTARFRVIFPSPRGKRFSLDAFSSNFQKNAAFWENPEKIWSNLAKIQQNSGKFCEFLEKKTAKKFSNF